MNQNDLAHLVTSPGRILCACQLKDKVADTGEPRINVHASWYWKWLGDCWVAISTGLSASSINDTCRKQKHLIRALLIAPVSKVTQIITDHDLQSNFKQGYSRYHHNTSREAIPGRYTPIWERSLAYIQARSLGDMWYMHVETMPRGAYTRQWSKKCFWFDTTDAIEYFPIMD